MPAAAIITAAASAGAAIGGTIAGVADANKRRKYEQNLMFLDAQQKKALNNTLLKQQSEEARQRVLAETLGTLNQSRISGMVSVEQEKEKTRRYTFIGIGVTVVGYWFMYLKPKEDDCTRKYIHP